MRQEHLHGYCVVSCFCLGKITALRKICKNTGFRWPIFSRRFIDSVLISKNTGLRARILAYFTQCVFWSQFAVTRTLKLKILYDSQKAGSFKISDVAVYIFSLQMPEYGFSLTLTLLYKSRIVGSVFIWENTGQRNPYSGICYTSRSKNDFLQSFEKSQEKYLWKNLISTKVWN